jgi:hypothetical protein
MLPPEDQRDALGQPLADVLRQCRLAIAEDADIREHFLASFVQLGISPLHARIVLNVIILLGKGAADSLGKKMLDSVAGWLERVPLLRGGFEKLATLTREGKAKAEILAALRADLKLPDGAPLPEEAGLDLVSALRTAQDLSDIQGEVALIRDWLAEQETNRAAPPLGWLMQEAGAAQTLTASLKYNSGRDAFVGREDVAALMERFCADPARFRWMTLTGDGGEGKTRFAFEYTRQLEARGWRAGRLSFEDLAQFRHADWRPAWPTFIVIDYAAADPGAVKALLSSIARTMQEDPACEAVRVLLLERSTAGEWFKTFEAADSETEAVRSVGWTHQGHPLWRGWALPPMGPDGIVALMQARLEEAGAPNVSPDVLLQAAARVDPRWVEGRLVPLPRPLFALAVAALAADAHARGADVAAALATLEPADVLRDIISRDRRSFWLPAAGGDATALERFENLAALATLLGGVSLEALKDGAFGFGDWLPPPPRAGVPNPMQSKILRAMGLARNGGCAPLEPDLLGARFVFDRLAALRENACGGDRALITAGWRAPFPHAGLFALRALNDAAADLAAADFLAPDVAEGVEAARGWSRFIIDLSNRCGARRDWAQIEAAFERLDRMRAPGAFPTDAAIALAAARSCTNLVVHAGAAGAWGHTQRALERLDALRAPGAFPADAAIALEEAKTCFNLALHAGVAGEWAQVEDPFARLGVLCAPGAFPPDTGIALVAAKVCTNLVSHAGAAGEWSWVKEAFKRLDDLRAQGVFLADADIALEVARACFNLALNAGAVGEWARVEDALSRLRALRSSGDFLADAAIALEEAKVCTNLVLHAGAAGDWARVERAFERLDALRAPGSFSADAAIALEEAKACVNLVNHLVRAKDWTRLAGSWDRALALGRIFIGSAELIALSGEAVIRAARLAIMSAPPCLFVPDRLLETVGLAFAAIVDVQEERAQFVVGPGLSLIKTVSAMLGPNAAEAEAWARGWAEANGVAWADVPLIERAPDAG